MKQAATNSSEIILISVDELKWKMDSDMCGELGLWARGLERYNKKTFRTTVIVLY